MLKNSPNDSKMLIPFLDKLYRSTIKCRKVSGVSTSYLISVVDIKNIS